MDKQSIYVRCLSTILFLVIVSVGFQSCDTDDLDLKPKVNKEIATSMENGTYHNFYKKINCRTYIEEDGKIKEWDLSHAEGYRLGAQYLEIDGDRILSPIIYFGANQYRAEAFLIDLKNEYGKESFPLMMKERTFIYDAYTSTIKQFTSLYQSVVISRADKDQLIIRTKDSNLGANSLTYYNEYYFKPIEPLSMMIFDSADAAFEYLSQKYIEIFGEEKYNEICER